MAETILIVDDDPTQRRLLEAMARRFGYEVLTAEGGDAGLNLLLDGASRRIDCVVLDLVMPDLDGFGVLARLKQSGLAIPVIVQTAHGGIDNVISAMRAGAADFVVKPVGPERLQVSLRNALAASALETELQRLKRVRAGTLTFKDIVSRSARMQNVLRTAQKAAGSDITVLLEGETGVGKELIARAIHGSSPRRSQPFVAVNCGAIPETLVESTLFGHEKGAFTGATERHLGKFVEASGGVLFLDEIGELPLPAQVKLLRAIQQGEVDSIGGRKPIRIDVRLISASNRNLLTLVKEGRFREDLFYRLQVFPIAVPPLRERPEDIPDLVRHFLARCNAEEGKRIRAISAAAMAALGAHPWPGNVRQLENAIFRAVVLAEGDAIDVTEIPQIAPSRPFEPGQPVAEPAPPQAEGSLSIESLPGPNLEVTAPSLTGEISPESPSGFLSVLDDRGDVRPLTAVESDLIRFAIAHYDGQMSEVARKLRIGRSTLYRRLKDLDLKSTEFGEIYSDGVAAE